MPKTTSASSKTTKTSKASKTVKAPGAGIVTSKTSAGISEHARSTFVAGAVLLAAALVAITLGLLTYTQYDTSRTADGKMQYKTGAMFLESTGSKHITPGSTVKVTVYENSGNSPVNTVQSAVSYPADKLQYVSVRNSQAFPQEAATDATTNGLVRLARSIKPDAMPVRGSKAVAVLEFRILDGAKSPIELSVEPKTSLLVRSTDNHNILDTASNPSLHLGE